MKLIALLCIVGLAAATPAWQWQSGKEHVFKYNGRLLTGIPELGSQYSGIGIKCDIAIQIKSLDDLRMTLRHVEFSRVNDVLSTPSSYGIEGSNWRNLELPGYTPASPEIVSLLSMPITFSVRDGEVKELTVSGAEEQWSLNFKKALVVLLQTKLEKSTLDLEMNTINKESYESKNYWKVSEETIDGVCDSIYQVNELPEYMVKERSDMFPKLETCPSQKYYEITKTKDLSSCKRSSIYSFLKPSVSPKNCVGTKCLSNLLGASSSVTRYYACGTRSSPILQSVVNEGEFSQQLFGYKAENFVTGTRQVLYLKGINTIQHSLPKPSQPRTIESVSYEYIPRSQELRSQIGLVPKIPQSELKNGYIYRYLPRHYLPTPTSQETQQKLSSVKAMKEIKELMVELMGDFVSSEQFEEKEIPLNIMSAVRALTILKVDEMKTVYTELKTRFGTSEDQLQLFQNIFFDSVVLSGTTPSVLFLKEMIKSEEMTKVQAVSVMMLLPHHVITPTKEVFESLFELIQVEPVVKNRVLYNTALLSLTNLVQKACVSSSRYITYPTEVFGEFCNPQSEIVVEKLIPYLAKELRSTRVPERRHVVIVALGVLTHKDVIPILLPVVEGKLVQRPGPKEYKPYTTVSGSVGSISGSPSTPCECEEQSSYPCDCSSSETSYYPGSVPQATYPGSETPYEYYSSSEFEYRNMTRYLAVYALGSAGSRHPELVNPVVFSIFNNPAENSEIRIAAFQVLIQNHPPMVYLHRIAATTWSEKNTEVLKVVYTSFYSISHQATMSSPVTMSSHVSIPLSHSEFVKEVQIVLPLMKRVSGAIPTSGSIYMSEFLPKTSSGYKSLVQWVSNYNSFIPGDLYYRIEYMLGGYSFSPLEFAFKMHGGENLYQKLAQIMKPLSGEEERQRERNYVEERVNQYEEELNELEGSPSSSYSPVSGSRYGRYQGGRYTSQSRRQSEEEYERRNGLYRSESERRSGVYGSESERRSGVYGSESERRSGVYGSESERRSGVYGSESERRSGVYGSESERRSGSYGTESERRSGYYGSGSESRYPSGSELKESDRRFEKVEGLHGYGESLKHKSELRSTLERQYEETIHQIKNSLHKEWKKVIEHLKIKVRENGPMSGAIYFNLFEDMKFFTSVTDVTNQLLQEKLSPLLSNPHKIMSKICGAHPLTFQRVLNVAPTEFMIPSDMGFPIIVETHMPVTVSVRGQFEVSCNVHKPSVTVDAKILSSSTLHGKVGTYCPFTKDVVATGVKHDIGFTIPARTHLYVEPQMNKMKISLKPIHSSSPVDILYVSTKPYTVHHSYYTFMPKITSANLKVIHSSQPLKKVNVPFGTPLGLTFNSIVESESRYLDLSQVYQTLKTYNYNVINMVRFVIFPSTSESGYLSFRRHIYRLQFNPSTSNTREIEMTFSIGCVTKYSGEEAKYHHVSVKSLEELQTEKFILKKLIPYTIVSRPVTEQVHPERQMMLKNIIEKLQLRSGIATFFKFTTVLHGSRPQTFSYQATAGYGNDILMKQKWHLQLVSEPQSSSLVQKLCVNGTANVPMIPSWDLNMIRSTNMDFQFKTVIGFGKTCEQSLIKISGNSKVSEEQKKWSRISPVGVECQKMIERQIPGALSSKSCKEATRLAKTIDEVDYKVEYINTPSYVSVVDKKSIELLKTIFWPYMTKSMSHTPTLAHIGEKREVMVRVVMDKSVDSVSLLINSPEETVHFKNIRIPYPINTVIPFTVGESNTLKGLESITGHSIYPACEVEKTWLRTFDNRSIPATLDDCFHLISGDCSSTFSYGVLARSVSKHTLSKEVKIFLNRTEILLSPGPSYSKYLRDVTVYVNGTEVPVEKNTKRVIREGENGEFVTEIFKSVDSVLSLRSPSYMLYVKFDGERLSVQTSQLLKNKLCGVCGDFNQQQMSDLRGPRKCIYSRPEVEVASYRVSTPQCSALEGSIKQKLETETHQCAKYSEYPTQVLKSFRKMVGECSRQVHKIVERGNEVCFSQLPVLQCGAQCSPKPRQLATTKVSFTCMTNGRMAELYREKVLQGQVLPELQGKLETFSTQILVPQTCVSSVREFESLNGNMISGLPIIPTASILPTGSSSEMSSSGITGGIPVSGVIPTINGGIPVVSTGSNTLQQQQRLLQQEQQVLSNTEY